MKATDLIIDIAQTQLGNPIVAGVNGPYHDPETRCRNLSHWLIIFSKCFRWTGDDRYLEEVKKAVIEITNDVHFPYKKLFYHRDKAGKDKTNGLIGQAWTIEALVEASKVLDDPSYLELAQEVFLNHHFSETEGLWYIMSLEGERMVFDPTFNHQLWFAAAGALLCEHPEIRRQVVAFMDNIPKNLTVLREGLIYHPIDRPLPQATRHFVKDSIRALLLSLYLHPAQLKRRFSKDKFYTDLIYKSIGYHAFNVYAFVTIAKHLNHAFFQTNAYQKTISYLLNDQFFDQLENNSFAYPYNAPGFEMPRILAFVGGNKSHQVAKRYLQQQLKQTYDPISKTFDLNNQDPVTLTARLYELVQTDKTFLDQIDLRNE